MTELLAGDLYRLKKSQLLRGIMILVCFLSFLLIITIRQDIRVGISVFGNLTAFKGIPDVIRVGTQYQKGLGILAAILISVFIGQEYQWKTWQHKWTIHRSRARIYLSKAAVSSGLSAAVFLVFESIALLSSGQIHSIVTSEYVTFIACGFALYSALGACICAISLAIKNNATSIVISLLYVLFSRRYGL
jgi:ABC-type transport system involved in multi-copper enzyme maturation permease subunit